MLKSVARLWGTKSSSWWRTRLPEGSMYSSRIYTRPLAQGVRSAILGKGFVALQFTWPEPLGPLFWGANWSQGMWEALQQCNIPQWGNQEGSEVSRYGRDHPCGFQIQQHVENLIMAEDGHIELKKCPTCMFNKLTKFHNFIFNILRDINGLTTKKKLSKFTC